MSRPSSVLAALALALSAGAVVVASRAPSTLTEPARHPTDVSVSAQTLVCPGAEVATPSQRAVFVAVPRLLRRDGASAAAGSVSVSRLSADPGRPTGGLIARGTSTVVRLPGDPTPTSVLGSAGLAPGLAASQWAKYGADQVSGTAAAACRPPGDQWWFSGVDTATGATSTLVLSNPSPAIAVVDLVFYGPDGLVQAVGDRGIALAPRSSRTLDLARFAPGLDAFTLAVHADQGRVVAAVRTDRSEVTAPAGTEWVPAGRGPARDVLVNASSDAPSQRLDIANPGTQEALVHVRLVDADGQFVPTGLGDVRVSPGNDKVLDLTPVTHGRAAAVHLTSNVGVTAGLVSSTERGARDLASTGSTPPLTEPAVVPVIPGTTLDLRFATAAAAGGGVTIDAFDAAGGSLSRDELRIPGATLSRWALPPSTKAAYVLVTVDSGTGLQGAATYQGRFGLTSLPVLSGIYTVRRPVVGPALPR